MLGGGTFFAASEWNISSRIFTQHYPVHENVDLCSVNCSDRRCSNAGNRKGPNRKRVLEK